LDDIWHEATLGRERELELRQRWLERQRELRREEDGLPKEAPEARRGKPLHILKLLKGLLIKVSLF